MKKYLVSITQEVCDDSAVDAETAASAEEKAAPIVVSVRHSHDV
jgi:hypothetical protein